MYLAQLGNTLPKETFADIFINDFSLNMITPSPFFLVKIKSMMIILSLYFLPEYDIKLRSVEYSHKNDLWISNIKDISNPEN